MSLQERRAELVQAFLDTNTPLEELHRPIINWFLALKDWERQDTFREAFKDQRMTARQIDSRPDQRGSVFQAASLGGGLGHEMLLEKKFDGIVARMNPENFMPQAGGQSQKNNLGLHDLSASLLDPDRLIDAQLKPYSQSTALFMPVPDERDLQLFYVLNELGKSLRRENPNFYNAVRLIRSRLTRIKLAEDNDIGASFVDVNPPDAAVGAFRYGWTGTKPTETGKFRKITDEEFVERRRAALHYRGILATAGKKSDAHNEIIIAYRQHDSPLFPVHAEWQPHSRVFWVLPLSTKTGTPAFVITNDGKWKAL